MYPEKDATASVVLSGVAWILLICMGAQEIHSAPLRMTTKTPLLVPKHGHSPTDLARHSARSGS
ncbi:hypothetical protein BH23CHL1_BH23CHL1_19730 [soil metagenome]